jgi:hypothetical protein
VQLVSGFANALDVWEVDVMEQSGPSPSATSALVLVLGSGPSGLAPMISVNRTSSVFR